MRILILLFILIFNAYLYAQDTNAVNNNIPANASENAIMQINRFDARRNPISFINLLFIESSVKSPNSPSNISLKYILLSTVLVLVAVILG